MLHSRSLQAYGCLRKPLLPGGVDLQPSLDLPFLKPESSSMEYMAVSMNGEGVLFAAVLIERALLLWGPDWEPDFWKLPYGPSEETPVSSPDHLDSLHGKSPFCQYPAPVSARVWESKHQGLKPQT